VLTISGKAIFAKHFVQNCGIHETVKTALWLFKPVLPAFFGQGEEL
jgi:hypothetical protein